MRWVAVLVAVLWGLSSQLALAETGDLRLGVYSEGWIVSIQSIRSEQCVASKKLGADRNDELVYRRSFRGDTLPSLSLRATVDTSFLVQEDGQTARATAELYWASNGAHAGRGYLARRNGPPLLVTFDQHNIAIFEAGTVADEALVVKVEGHEVGRVRLGIIAVPLEKFSECYLTIGETLRSARPDFEEVGSGEPGPVPTEIPDKWFDASSYPPRALREERGGRTAFSVDVDRYGYVTGCTITESSGSEYLDTATCRNVSQNARFYPARDSSDESVEGNWSYAIYWRTN